MSELLKFTSEDGDQQRDRSKDDSMMPNRITYTALFKVIAASSIPDKVERAKFWLEQSANKNVREDEFLLQRILDMENKG
jgi:hypothetical protein